MKQSDDPRMTLEGWIREGALRRSEGVTSISLARAMFSLCGGPASNDETAATGVDEIKKAIGEYPHLLFVLVDGLGINQKSHFPKGGFFETHLDRTIRSVFPSTTSAALTSLASAEWPATHAITGWFTHIPKHNATVIPITGVMRSDESPIEQSKIPYSDIMQVESVYPKLTRAVDIYTFEKFTTGHFADWYGKDIEITPYRHLTNAVRQVRRGIHRRVRRNTPSFSYVYFSQIDHLSHSHGRENETVCEEIDHTDAALMKLRAVLPDSVRMIVTADHGHINIPKSRHYVLTHDNPILDMLECPPSGEARVPLFHVKDGFEESFTAAFEQQYGDNFILITPDDAEALNLYGPVPLSPEMRKRLGTYIGVSRTADAIEYVSEGHESIGHIGMHGGMSPHEVEVPLFLA